MSSHANRLTRAATLFVLWSATTCCSSSAPPQSAEPPLLAREASRAPDDARSAEAHAEEPAGDRTAIMVKGLERVIANLEAGRSTPNDAFDQIAFLEKTVGPPRFDLPPLENACRTDADCALTELVLEGTYTCCPSLLRTAGTVGWVSRFESTCSSYEKLRGNRPILLPRCGDITGPISATHALCKSGRCVPCLRSTDGSPDLCHEPPSD